MCSTPTSCCTIHPPCSCSLTIALDLLLDDETKLASLLGTAGTGKTLLALAAWMQPVFDNLTYLLSSRGVGSQHAESKSAEQRTQNMVNSGKLVLEPLTYIRSRSIPN